LRVLFGRSVVILVAKYADMGGDPHEDILFHRRRGVMERFVCGVIILYSMDLI